MVEISDIDAVQKPEQDETYAFIERRIAEIRAEGNGSLKVALLEKNVRVPYVWDKKRIVKMSEEQLELAIAVGYFRKLLDFSRAARVAGVYTRSW